MPAVTVALWGLIFGDDPDRRAREQAWRRRRVVETLVADLGCDEAEADRVWSRAVHTFRVAWLEEQHTPGIAYCLGEGLAAHGLRPGAGFDELVADLETRALVDPPDLLPDAREVIAALADRWPVGVVSDALVTPAPVLRELLDGLGLAEHIDAAVFSDELGAAKPARTPFRIAARELGVNLDELVHAGPSESRDVAGALAAGAWAVKVGPPPTEAEARCDRLCDLPAAVERVVEGWSV